MKRTVAILTIALAFALSGHAHAKKKGGVSMPDTKTVAGKTLVLNGMGIREATFLKVDVYVAGLYLEKKSKDGKAIINSDQIKELNLRFVRDVDKGDIKDAWKEGFKKNSGKHYNELKPFIKQLNGWMTDFKEGQLLTFTYVPGKGTTISINGKAKGTISDVYFGRVLVSIFLGRPPNEGLKKGLLGR